MYAHHIMSYLCGRNRFGGKCAHMRTPTVLDALCSSVPRPASSNPPRRPSAYSSAVLSEASPQRGQPLSFLGGRPPYVLPASSIWPLRVALEAVSVALGCRLALQLVQWLWTTARSPATIPR